MIYLDNAATTKVAPEVIEAMMPYFTDEYGNAGTLYKLGRTAADAVRKAREQVSLLFGCSPDHVIFTSGGSEGNNMVFKGLRQMKWVATITHNRQRIYIGRYKNKQEAIAARHQKELDLCYAHSE